ncbi:hypothetical protein ACWCQM_01820 [Streptomyces sp. NPDC002125]
MGIGVNVLDIRRKVEWEITDDDENSILRYCTEAPDTTVRWGVMAYQLTLFNHRQLRKLVQELEETPDELMVPVLKQLLDGARHAFRQSGYLLFIGD